MKIYKILLCLFIVFSFTSCYSDKGNYDYNDINEVKIEGLPNENKVLLRFGEVLHIEPKITYSLNNNEDDYIYKWVAINKNSSPDSDYKIVIGEEKNLEYFIEIETGGYWVYCYVTDKNSGIEWSNKFEITVTSVTREGWLVLQNDNNRTRLDMLSVVGDKNYHLKDILKNSDLKYNHPKEVVIGANMFINYYTPSVILVTEEGTTYLDSETLECNETMDLIYDFGDIMPTIKAKSIYYSFYNALNLIITDDYMYSRDAQSYGSIYSLPINKIEGEEEYIKLAPFIGSDINSTSWDPQRIVYDNEKQRFLQVNNAKATALIVPTIPENVFSNTTNKSMVTMFNAKHGGGAQTYSILKDDKNKLWLYGFNLLYTFEQLKDYYYQINATNIENATLFAMHPFNRYLFYVYNNTIYQFDMITKASKELAYSFNGEEITFIKFNILYSGNYGKPQSYADNEYRLIVGSTKTATGNEDNGIIRMFDIDNSFIKDAKLFKEYTGFSKPVDIVYRERLN